MFQINTNFNKIRIPLILALAGFSGLFLYQYLTFIPDYSSAKSISTNNPVTPTTPLTEWDDLEYMQQMTLEACNSANMNDTKQLTDSRDGKTYWVTKLKDNQCWMTQNLDLDLYNSNTNQPVTLTSNDSDMPLNDDQTAGEWKSTTGPSTISGYNTNNYYLAQYYDPGNTYCNVGECSTTVENNGHNHQGNLYSWIAATAGTGIESITSGDVDSSICPKGWQLPTSGNTNPKSFGGLTTAYAYSITSIHVDSTTLRAAPLYFIYSGYMNNSSLSNAGSYGFYWSSTARNNRAAYNLDIRSIVVNPSGNVGRYVGYAVRCVAKDLSASDIPSESTSGIDSPNISVTIPNIITLDVSDSVSIETKTNDISEGSFTASVSSNASYSITLSSTNGGHTDLRNENGSGAIPTLTSSQSLTPGISAWGIKCTNPVNSTNCLKTSYTGLTDYLNPTLFFKSTTGGLNLSTTFQIGIAVSPDLPSGTYTTDILVTAATSD